MPLARLLCMRSVTPVDHRLCGVGDAVQHRFCSCRIRWHAARRMCTSLLSETPFPAREKPVPRSGIGDEPHRPWANMAWAGCSGTGAGGRRLLRGREEGCGGARKSSDRGGKVGVRQNPGAKILTSAMRIRQSSGPSGKSPLGISGARFAPPPRHSF
jgi:hypothetical protein